VPGLDADSGHVNTFINKYFLYKYSIPEEFRKNVSNVCEIVYKRKRIVRGWGTGMKNQVSRVMLGLRDRLEGGESK